MKLTKTLSVSVVIAALSAAVGIVVPAVADTPVGDGTSCQGGHAWQVDDAPGQTPWGDTNYVSVDTLTSTSLVSKLNYDYHARLSRCVTDVTLSNGSVVTLPPGWGGDGDHYNAPEGTTITMVQLLVWDPGTNPRQDTPVGSSCGNPYAVGYNPNYSLNPSYVPSDSSTYIKVDPASGPYTSSITITPASGFLMCDVGGIDNDNTHWDSFDAEGVSHQINPGAAVIQFTADAMMAPAPRDISPGGSTSTTTTTSTTPTTTTTTTSTTTSSSGGGSMTTSTSSSGGGVTTTSTTSSSSDGGGGNAKTAAFPAPGGVRVVKTSHDPTLHDVNVTWGAIPGVRVYIVDRKVGNGPWKPFPNVGTSFPDDNLPFGRVSYKVAAGTPAGDPAGQFSSPVTVTFATPQPKLSLRLAKEISRMKLFSSGLRMSITLSSPGGCRCRGSIRLLAGRIKLAQRNVRSQGGSVKGSFTLRPAGKFGALVADKQRLTVSFTAANQFGGHSTIVRRVKLR